MVIIVKQDHNLLLLKNVPFITTKLMETLQANIITIPDMQRESLTMISEEILQEDEEKEKEGMDMMAIENSSTNNSNLERVHIRVLLLIEVQTVLRKMNPDPEAEANQRAKNELPILEGRMILILP